VQIFKGQYVCTACYQLPLIRGCPTISDLEQLAMHPVQTWLADNSSVSAEVSDHMYASQSGHWSTADIVYRVNV